MGRLCHEICCFSVGDSRFAFSEPSSYSWKSRQFVTCFVLVRFIHFKENVQEDCQVT